MTIQSRQNKSGGFRRSLVAVPTSPLRKSWRPLWPPSNSAPCQVLREHRKNSTACSRKGWRPRNSRRTNFGGPSIGGRTPCLPSIKAARDDVVRQFRYYLVTLNLAEVAVRFRDSVRRTVQALREHPLVGARYGSSNPQLRNLRSWPVAGFEAIRIYYLLDEDTLRIIRILHGKRDVKHILEGEKDI